MAKKNPTNEITKVGPLGGSIEKVEVDDPTKPGQKISVDLSAEERPDYSSKHIKEELDELGLEASEEIEVENPVTHQKTKVIVQRDGTPESKLIIALADPEKSRDQKDAILGMYLFERGKESSSFLMDLFRYKGSHTKETRAFKSQMRFDFEMFVGLFTNYLESVGKGIWGEMELDISPEEFLEGYTKYVKEGGERSILSYSATLGLQMSQSKAGVIQMAIRSISEAQKLRDTVAKMTEARMREKGFGIYIDTTGKPYSIFTDDHEIDDVIKRDRERIEQVKKEEGLS